MLEMLDYVGNNLNVCVPNDLIYMTQNPGKLLVNKLKIRKLYMLTV